MTTNQNIFKKGWYAVYPSHDMMIPSPLVLVDFFFENLLMVYNLSRYQLKRYI